MAARLFKPFGKGDMNALFFPRKEEIYVPVSIYSATYCCNWFNTRRPMRVKR